MLLLFELGLLMLLLRFSMLLMALLLLERILRLLVLVLKLVVPELLARGLLCGLPFVRLIMLFNSSTHFWALPPVSSKTYLRLGCNIKLEYELTKRAKKRQKKKGGPYCVDVKIGSIFQFRA